MTLKTNKLRDAIVFALVAGATSAVGMGTALAQQTPEEETLPGQIATPTTTTELDRIQVTGSRIKRVDIEPVQPMSTVSSEYIELRNLNAQQAVTQMPSAFAGATPNIGANQQGAAHGVGQRTLSLYGLGSQRTLTLVNGNRFISSQALSGGASAPGLQVDVNNIPSALIDRVEVVKVGGAAVYGADAVAGVVNYILRRDYEGAEFSYNLNSIGGGIGNEHTSRFLVGGNFNENRGNLVLSLEHNKAPDIAFGQVPSLADSWTSQTPLAGDRVLRENGTVVANQVRLYPQPRAGILSVGGVITPGDDPWMLTSQGWGAWPDGNYYQFDANGNVVPFNIGTPTGNSTWSSGGDGLDLALANTAREGYERYNVTALANYALTDDINLSVSVFNNRMEANNQGYQVLYNSGIWNGTDGGAIRFNLDNPYLNEASRARISEIADEDGNFYMHRAWEQLGNRYVSNEGNVNLYRAALDGSFEIGNRLWDWEVSAQQGFSSVTSHRSGMSNAHWWAALDVGINPETGQIDCRYNYVSGLYEEYRPGGHGLSADDHPLGPIGSCVPYNPFGLASEAAVNYATYSVVGHAQNRQKLFNAYLSGGLFDLPAGTFNVALGAERRTESAKYTADGTSFLQGLPSASAEGRYTTDDIYGEFYLPITSTQWNLPGLYSLSLEGSYRQMDNNMAGKDEAWAVGLNWRPIEDLVFRANFSETVRAPALQELFQSRLAVSGFAADPCDNRNLGNGPNPAIRAANCLADGVPLTDSATGLPWQSNVVNASRRGWSGGNQNLENEQAESLNLGLLYAPRWAPGLEISADYVEIDLTNAIVEFTLTNIMEACYDAADFPNRFCDMFVRQADGQLPQLDAYEVGYVNAALRRFRAYEYEIRYLLDTQALGQFGFNLRAYNVKENVTSNTGFDRTDITGQYNSPKWRGSFGILHRYGDLTSYVDVNYHGRGKRNIFQTEPLQYIDQNGQPYDEITSMTTTNVGFSYNFAQNINLRLGIQNVFDWYPSEKELALGRWTYGRSYDLGVTVKF